MPPSVSDTTVESTTPSFSPFESGRSISESTSGLTSDDAPDLGAFLTVFRALNTLQPPRLPGARFNNGGEDATPTSTFAFSDYESDGRGSTVWSLSHPASYLTAGSPPPSSSSPEPTEGDSVADHSGPSHGSGDADQRDAEEDPFDNSGQPSLGLLGALDFLAAERAKFAASRDAVSHRGNSSTTSDGTWQHALSPRRKRRRKRNRSAGITKNRRRRPEDSSGGGAGEAEDTVEGATASYDDADESSSSDDPLSRQQYYKSTPPTPPPELQGKPSAAHATPRLHHSKSTPSLRLPASMPIDARVLQLRNLANKLRVFFSKDAACLSAVLSNDHPSPDEVVDPRGPEPRSKDTLIHIFIDHSNILFGFLTFLRRHFRRLDRRPRYISHAALALILERGRPVTRRVLVTSSPLYQPVDSAEQLGYEASVLRRVPDMGDGPDRHTSSSSGEQGRAQHSSSHPPALAYTRSPNQRKAYAAHGHKSSVASVTSESDPSSGANGGRIRYREQGVDELLQLKLLQAIADVDQVPKDGTIVLATGDGNVGQFNEDGFLGCVRTALKKGWKVELYAWEGSLSKAWMREFGSNDRFVIYGLDRFAMDLFEL